MEEGETPRLAVTLRLPPLSTAPSSARHLLRFLGDAVGPAALDDIELMVSELVTNSYLHAGLCPTDRVELTAKVWRDLVRVEVVDPGPGFSPPDGTFEASVEPRGRGLYIVDQLADRWGVEQTDRSRVWFEVVPDQMAVDALGGRAPASR